MIDGLEQHLTPPEQELIRSLDSPARIQLFLDAIPYSGEDANRTPVQVLRERAAHCYDGALFAAAALSLIGHPPVLVDLLPEPGTDDDHVLAIFRHHGLIGAVAKSNFAGLRYREPIYRSLRELVLSYFESFFNVEGQKTLRAYTASLNLSRLTSYVGHGKAPIWMWEIEAVQAIERQLHRLRRIPLLPAEAASRLQPVDERSYAAGMLGTDPAGLYVPFRGSGPAESPPSSTDRGAPFGRGNSQETTRHVRERG